LPIQFNVGIDAYSLKLCAVALAIAAVFFIRALARIQSQSR
jgi:hypothetical protein